MPRLLGGLVALLLMMTALNWLPSLAISPNKPVKPNAESGTSKSSKSTTAATSHNDKNKSVESGPFTNNHYVLTGTMEMNGYHAEDPTLVIVDKGSHDTYVLQLQNDKVVRVLTVSNAIGKKDKPTPPGRYSVLYKKKFPQWIPPKSIDKKQKPVPPYNDTHKNPLGVAAIFLNKDELALHGTNDPKEIRKSASHGCVRHSNQDISKIYDMVDKGDTVMIIRQFRGTVLNKSDFKPRHKKSD